MKLLSAVLNSFIEVRVHNFFNLHFYDHLFFIAVQILPSISASQSALQTFYELKHVTEL